MANEDFSEAPNGPSFEDTRSQPTVTPEVSAEANEGGEVSKASARRLILIVSFWAGLAGLTSWWIGEAKVLSVTAKQERFMAAGRQIEWSTPTTRNVAARINSARLHAVFGGLLGLALGLTGGVVRRSPGWAVVAGIVGASLGAGLGAVVTYFVLPIYVDYRQWHSGDLVASLVLHTSLWAGIGAASGLALGLGLGGRLRPLKTAAGGLLGAIGGGLFFDLLGALVFPLEETGEPTSTTARTRLLARLLVAILSAAGAALAAGQISERVGTTDRR
jgi:hypothetical protein